MALVTGAASGIGRAVAERLTAEGATVWLGDRDADAATTLVRQLERARAVRLDVTDPEDWIDAARQIRADRKGWHVLVNAAGVSRAGLGAQGVAEVALDGWRTVFAVNVEGTLLGCQRAMAEMDAGAIVNIASTAALAPSPTLAAYGATKAAVVQLTRSVAAACVLAGIPVRCNAVAPGMVETPMTDGLAPAMRERWIDQIPAGRFATPSEIAVVILFLASQDASYVNGACHVVDGGLLSRPTIK